MKILTAAEMANTDRRSAEEFGVKSDDLMKQAGEAVAAFCLRHYRSAMYVTVLCGRGNNGGDGFVAAHALARAGRTVRVVLLGRVADLKGDAAKAFAFLQEAYPGPEIPGPKIPGLEIPGLEITEIADEAALTHALDHAELLLDAVVGTGFTPPLRGLAAITRDLLAQSTVPVVAVDLPSGWNADATGQTSADAFRADAVVTFTAPKLAHIFGHLTGQTFGPVVVADIGSPSEAIQSATGLTWGGTSKAIAEKPRTADSNKGLYGHVLLVGGSYGKAGAPSMSSLAGLRAGAGLVTAAVPAGILNTVALVAPELMLTPLAESDGAANLSNLDPGNLEKLLKGMHVIAIGPGLSTDGEASAFARQFVQNTTLPIVIDADALNAFDGHADLLNGTGRTMVLTPHPGEMARLLGMTVKQVEADRVKLARTFATEHHLTLVLKGWRTLIVHPDGSIAVNTSGNPSLAKGGSGDILTGIIAAMVAQFPGDIKRAVEAAVYLHGLAGDFAALAMDEHTVLATDTVAHLTEAFRYRVQDGDGLTWLAGVHP